MSTGTDCTGDVLEDLLLTTTLIRTSLNRQCRAFPVLGRLDHHPLMARFSSHVETTVECGVALTDWMLSLHRFETERDKITIWPPLPINEFSKKPRPSQPFCGHCDLQLTEFNITSMELLKKHPCLFLPQNLEAFDCRGKKGAVNSEVGV